MSGNQPELVTLSCRCGAVEFEAAGKPIMTAACYCASCQEAGAGIERLPDASPVLEADGGTNFVLHRKDRIRCVKGGERLEDHRIRPDSPTRRVVATCCNSAMFLEFSKGHWLSLYREPDRRRPAADRDLGDDPRPARGCGAARRFAQLRYAFGQIHVEAAGRLGRNGLPRACH